MPHACSRTCTDLPPDEAKFDSKMNMQMFTQAISGLLQIYEDMRAIGVDCPNEPEFQVIATGFPNCAATKGAPPREGTARLPHPSLHASKDESKPAEGTSA